MKNTNAGQHPAPSQAHKSAQKDAFASGLSGIFARGGAIHRFYTKQRARAIFITLAGIFVFMGTWALRFPPEPIATDIPPRQISVTIREIETIPYHPIISSYGVVRPRTQSNLVAQVGGMVTEINPNFRSGGFFNVGDTLLVIDPSDYEVALAAQEAVLSEAEHTLMLEEARVEMALVDWRRLGNEDAAPDLVLRKPQLASARSRKKSAQAAVDKARLDLRRTHVQAPYAGRMLAQQVDLGEVVSAGTVLGTVYATDYMEVRLPLRNNDLDFVDLPEPTDTRLQRARNSSEVRLNSSLYEGESWLARMVRTESALDDDTRQLHVVAEIADPHRLKNGAKRAPKIGEYVSAAIRGSLVPEAIVVENHAIYQNDFVYLLENGLLVRRAVEILWQNENESLLGDGINPGDVLVTNYVGGTAAGYKAVIENQDVQGGRLDNGGTASSSDAQLITSP